MARVGGKAVTWNFLFGSLIVFGWIAYGALSGRPIGEQCLGFRSGARTFGAPAWLVPALVEAVFLVLFFARGRIGEGRVRLCIGLYSSWTLLFDVLCPLFFNEAYGGDSFTPGMALWSYVALANIMYAIFGEAE